MLNRLYHQLVHWWWPRKAPKFTCNEILMLKLISYIQISYWIWFYIPQATVKKIVIVTFFIIKWVPTWKATIIVSRWPNCVWHSTHTCWNRKQFISFFLSKKQSPMSWMRGWLILKDTCVSAILGFHTWPLSWRWLLLAMLVPIHMLTKALQCESSVKCRVVLLRGLWWNLF